MLQRADSRTAGAGSRALRRRGNGDRPHDWGPRQVPSATPFSLLLRQKSPINMHLTFIVVVVPVVVSALVGHLRGLGVTVLLRAAPPALLALRPTGLLGNVPILLGILPPLFLPGGGVVHRPSGRVPG